jgi:hypothetical protein
MQEDQKRQSRKKLFVNKCHGLLKENPRTIIGEQETHFKENNTEGMYINEKFKSHNSTYYGDGYRQ